MRQNKVIQGWPGAVVFALGLGVSFSIAAAQNDVARLLEDSPRKAWANEEDRLGSLQPGEDYVASEVLVEFEQFASQTASIDAVRAKGDRLGQVLENLPSVATVKLKEGQSVRDAVRAYQADPRVKRAQPNYIYRTSATTPDDTQFSQLWGLQNTGQTVNGETGTAGKDIGAPQAWDLLTDCRSIRIAVLDTGINYNHADLADNMWDGAGSGHPSGRDFVGSNDGDPFPTDGGLHGTHVASTIAGVGNNATGVTGVCWQAEIMAVRVLEFGLGGTTADIVEGIDYAVNNGARIINMSLGGGFPDDAMRDALVNARDKGVLVVAAAGNEGQNVNQDQSPVVPCSFDLDNIICVAALDQDYSLASFSNFGDSAVDVGAPGVNVLSNFPGSRQNFDFLTWSLDPSWSVDTTCATVDLLVNPADWCSGGPYANNLNARAFKTFDTSSVQGVGYGYSALFTLNDNGDATASAHSGGASPGDPFDSGSVDGGAIGPVDDSTVAEFPAEDCVGTNCSIGFALATDGSGQARGVAVGNAFLQTATDGATSTAFLDGTSMAAPHVTGIAALAWAVVPDKSYSEIRTAVFEGGDAEMSLSSTTTTGRAADAFKAIQEANDPPTAEAANGQTEENSSVDISIEADDPNGHELNFSVDEAPDNGSVAFSGNTARYTPDNGFIGEDSFTVLVDDGFTGTTTSQVDMTVVEAPEDGGGGGGGGGCTLASGDKVDPLLPGLALLALALGLRRRLGQPRP